MPHGIEHLFLLFSSFFLTLCLNQRTYHWLLLKNCLHWNFYSYRSFTYCLHHSSPYDVESVRIRSSWVMNVRVNNVLVFRNYKQFLNLIWFSFTGHERYPCLLKFYNFACFSLKFQRTFLFNICCINNKITCIEILKDIRFPFGNFERLSVHDLTFEECHKIIIFVSIDEELLSTVENPQCFESNKTGKFDESLTNDLQILMMVD